MDNTLIFSGFAILGSVCAYLLAEKGRADMDALGRHYRELAEGICAANPPPAPVWYSRGRYHYTFVRGGYYAVSSRGRVKELALNQVIVLKFGRLTSVLPSGNTLLEVNTVNSANEE